MLFSIFATDISIQRRRIRSTGSLHGALNVAVFEEVCKRLNILSILQNLDPSISGGPGVGTQHSRSKVCPSCWFACGSHQASCNEEHVCKHICEQFSSACFLSESKHMRSLYKKHSIVTTSVRDEAIFPPRVQRIVHVTLSQDTLRCDFDSHL